MLMFAGPDGNGGFGWREGDACMMRRASGRSARPGVGRWPTEEDIVEGARRSTIDALAAGCIAADKALVF